METLFTTLVYLGLAYALIGILFGIPFVLRGVGKLDANAREGSWGFRLLILPGACALWPLMLKRVLSGSTQAPVEDNAHRRAAREVAS